MTEVPDLRGRGVVVTGGTRGLGKALVLGFARHGAHVAFCGRKGSEAVAESVIEEATATSGQDVASPIFVPADVSSESDVEAFFDAVSDRLPSIDIVVNNAGVLLDALLIQTSLEEWNQVLAVNLRGAFLVARRAVDEFLGSGNGGRLVHVGSIAGNGSTGQAAYASSKSALLSLSRSIAKEYGRRRVYSNVVVPGYLETEMTDGFSEEGRRTRERLSPERRFGRPEEVVESVLFLASDEASFVNGDALYVSGAVRDIPDLR